MDVQDLLIRSQENEITEHLVYLKLAGIAGKNRQVLQKIAREEMKHYRWFAKKTGREV